MTPTTSTDWKRPPVIEVVLGVQFEPIQGFSNGHLGWFWRTVAKDYRTATDANPIQPVIESFGDGPQFGLPQIEFSPHRGDSRLRMLSDDKSRMLQLQNGWLVANWLKREGLPYPGYQGVLSEFKRALKAFQDFASSEGIGKVVPNLWEVTYIDHIPRGTVWNEVEDIPKVIPGLLGPFKSPHGDSETLSGKWVFRLKPRPARLVVAVQSARTTTDPPQDLLVVTSTARGPVEADRADRLVEYLNFGRSVVVETFEAVTSREARAYWKG